MDEIDRTQNEYAYSEMELSTAEQLPKKIQKRIAIVDDDWELANLFGNMLRRRGYTNVKTFRSADIFVNQINAEGDTFDVVLMDYRMPVMDGLQAIEVLKNNHANVKIVMVTGDIAVKKRAIAAGADGFLLKPFSVRVLLKEIQKLSENSEE